MTANLLFSSYWLTLATLGSGLASLLVGATVLGEGARCLECGVTVNPSDPPQLRFMV